MVLATDANQEETEGTMDTCVTEVCINAIREGYSRH